MKNSILVSVIIWLLSTTGQLSGNPQGYRIAGIIAFGEETFQTIVEIPSGEQRLVREGDFLDDVQIFQISADTVTLLFPDGERQMQLTTGDYIYQSAERYRSAEPVQENPVNYGIAASEFGKRLDKALAPELVDGIRGLQALQRLNPSARLVSVSYVADPESEKTPLESLESGVDILRDAIVAKKELRITVEGDPSIPDIYVMPNQLQ